MIFRGKNQHSGLSELGWIGFKDIEDIEDAQGGLEIMVKTATGVVISWKSFQSLNPPNPNSAMLY